MRIQLAVIMARSGSARYSVARWNYILAKALRENEWYIVRKDSSLYTSHSRWARARERVYNFATLRRNPRKKERDGEVEPDLRFSLLRPASWPASNPGRKPSLTYLPTYAPQTRLHNDRISHTLHTCQGEPLFHLHLSRQVNLFDAVTCQRLNLAPTLRLA